jgi:hypothetical protein
LSSRGILAGRARQQLCPLALHSHKQQYACTRAHTRTRTRTYQARTVLLELAYALLALPLRMLPCESLLLCPLTGRPQTFQLGRTPLVELGQRFAQSGTERRHRRRLRHVSQLLPRSSAVQRRERTRCIHLRERTLAGSKFASTNTHSLVMDSGAGSRSDDAPSVSANPVEPPNRLLVVRRAHVTPPSFVLHAVVIRDHQHTSQPREKTEESSTAAQTSCAMQRTCTSALEWGMAGQ